MFYHARGLKYVEYGKVSGFVEEDDLLNSAYKWLSSYCKFFPQVWLSRSSSSITGIRYGKDKILFGFDYIKGFSIDYSEWENLLFVLLNEKCKFSDLEKLVRENFRRINIEDDKENLKGKDRIFPSDNYEYWRDNYLFVEHDQVVVPSLNLKSAKEVICSNEKQKKKLRKMGFIEDRIKVRNVKRN